MGLGTSPDIGVEDIGGGVRGVIVLGEADPGHLVAEDVKATGIADETDKAIDPVVRGNADALGLAGALALSWMISGVRRPAPAMSCSRCWR